MRFLTVLATVTALSSPVWAEGAPSVLSVTGEGVIEASPDMATVSLGVTTEGDTAKAAMDSNNSQLAMVIEHLKSAGVEDRDIQTTGLSLGPRYDYNTTNSSGQNVINGYIATNMVTVRVRALEGLGAVLDAAVSDGANTLNGVTFGLQDPAPQTDAARKLAVESARHKAELYAEAAGVKLGDILSITDQSSYSQPMPMAMGAVAFDKAAVPVASGSLSLSSSVQMTFAISQ